MDSTQSLSELVQSLHDRMSRFEEALQEKAPQPTTGDTLAADYAAFRTFTLSVLRSLQQQVEILAHDADSQEMRSRRKIILVHGVTEDSKEDTAAIVAKTFCDKLKLTDFTGTSISRCHRMGRLSNSDRPRPILVKIQDTATRDKVWFAKTNLKGSSVTISEFLTRPRHQAFMEARHRFGVKNCWTRDGYIHIIGPDNVRHRICSLSELNKLSLLESRRPAATEAAPPTTSIATRPPSTRRAVKK